MMNTSGNTRSPTNSDSLSSTHTSITVMSDSPNTADKASLSSEYECASDERPQAPAPRPKVRRRFK